MKKRIIKYAGYIVFFILAMWAWGVDCSWWRNLLGIVSMGFAFHIYTVSDK